MCQPREIAHIRKLSDDYVLSTPTLSLRITFVVTACVLCCAALLALLAPTVLSP